MRRIFGYLIPILIAVVAVSGAIADTVTMKIAKEPMHDGRISPMLYGSFIELWDDHVSGMWAEMLNDRGFDGVLCRADWNYYIGEPNICDRKWDLAGDCSYETRGAFNGAQCAKLTATAESDAVFSQSDQATVKGMRYAFSGHFRANSPNVRIQVVLKSRLPDETWMTLASADIPAPGKEWSKATCEMISIGTTDRAVFELRVIGEGTVWADRISLMPMDNMMGWRCDVIDAIRELGPPVVRWGGSVIDPGWYKWKTSIGDRDRRPPFPNEVWGRIDPNDVGIDEFLQFCELVGAEPIICVCFRDGADNTRDLVRYCNEPAAGEWGRKRSENGHPKPYGVTYWQIGNEMAGEEYEKDFLAFCKAIEEADPKASILAAFPSEEMVRGAGQYIDYVCPHYYTDDFDFVEKEIRDFAAMLRRVSPEHSIGLGITEWNVTNPWGFKRGKLMTLDFAMGNARFLNIFHRNSDTVRIACRSNMCNSLCDGAIQTRPSGVLKTAGYYVMKLYREHTKPIPVSIDRIPEEMDATACRSEDGESLTVFLVNMKGDPVGLNLDLKEYGPSFHVTKARAVCDTQDRRQIDIMNLWDAPDRIRIIDIPVRNGRLTAPAYSVLAIECGGE